MGTPASPEAVKSLVEDHYAALYRYAFRLSGKSADAEDLTQETFVKAQAKLGQLRSPDRARPWLFSILRNAYLHHARDERHVVVVPLDGVGDLAEPLPDPLPEIDPEQLQHALRELPEVYRTPVILFYFEGFGYRDIAEQMDLPIGTVMSRLARAKAHLRARLLPAGEAAGFGPARRATNGLQ
jgi:RNA polymerase sigma factor (sigma-70 family)